MSPARAPMSGRWLKMLVPIFAALVVALAATAWFAPHSLRFDGIVAHSQSTGDSCREGYERKLHCSL